MNTAPTKSRRPVLLLIVLIGVVMFLGMLLVHNKRTRPLADVSDNTDKLTETSEVISPLPAPSPSLRNTNAGAKFSAQVSNAAATSVDPHLLAYLKPPWQDALAPAGERSITLGVVAIDRVIAAHRTSTNSPVARARLLRDIRDSVASRAHAHGLALVLDSSGKTSLETPFIVATNNPVDITDEVLAELSR